MPKGLYADFDMPPKASQKVPRVQKAAAEPEPPAAESGSGLLMRLLQSRGPPANSSAYEQTGR